MKKKLFAAILICLVFFTGNIISVQAIDTSEAQYIGTVRETNGSYTASNVCVPFNLDTQFLIDAGYIDSDCLDSTLTLSNGDAVTYMPAISGYSDWILFDPEIAQNSSENYKLYLGGGDDMDGDIVYFPGDAGMTVADAASLEPSNNFEIEIDGFIDTSSGSDKNLINKESSLKLSVSGSQELTASMYYDAAPTVVSTNTDYDSGTSLTVNLPADIAAGNLLLMIMAESNVYEITCPEGWTLLYSKDYSTTFRQRCYYKVANGGEGATITVSLATSANLSSVSYQISNWSGNIYCGTASTSNSSTPNPPNCSTGISKNYLWIETASTGYSNTLSSASAGYADPVSRSGNGASILTARRTNTAASEDPGNMTISNSTAWISNTIGIDGNASKTVTDSSIPIGEHIVKLSADGSNMYLYVDDVLKDTEALSGATCVNNANNWALCENSSVLYLRSAEITIGGTLKGSWTWENDTTFTDLSGNSNNATPSFRVTSSDVDVSAAIITLESILLSEYETDGSGSGTGEIITTTIPAPDNLYSELDINLPGADLIDELLDAADIPNSLFWFPVLFGSAMMLGIFIFAFARDIMIQSLINGAALAFFGINGGLPFWVVIPFILMSVSVIIARKTVSM